MIVFFSDVLNGKNGNENQSFMKKKMEYGKVWETEWCCAHIHMSLCDHEFHIAMIVIELCQMYVVLSSLRYLEQGMMVKVDSLTFVFLSILIVTILLLIIIITINYFY